MSLLPVAHGRQTFRVLARSAAARPLEAVLATNWTVLASAGVVAVPLLLGKLGDEVRSFDRTLLLLTATAAVLGAIFTALAQRAIARVVTRVAADLREEVMSRTLTLEPRVTEAAGSGDITSRVTDDVEDFISAVPMLTAVASAATTVGAAAIGAATLDGRLALTFFVTLPVYWIGLCWYLPRSGPAYAGERRAAAERGRVLLETLDGLPTVRAYGMSRLQTQRVEAASAEALDARLRSLWLALWLTKAMNTAEAVGLSSIFLTGYLLVRADAVSLGEVTAAALLFHRLFDPLGTLLGSFDEVQRAGAAAVRIVGVVLMPVPPKRAARPPTGPVGLTASGLRHSYDQMVDVVGGVSLEVPPGGSLALVGMTGAGKSTLAAILAGVFPASSGRVSVRDSRSSVDLADLGSENLREWIGLVTQETCVFTGTLRQDLTFAVPDASDAQLWSALRQVKAHRWVTLLPYGLDTRVGVGEHPLTPVQAKQLALARLILRDPPVVVLDEATAEAGSAGAQELESAAAALVAGRTAVVIAHRLSQACACDRIAVMAEGQIRELGTHEELLASGGRYARMWSAWSSS